ncbi:hypothetical protein PAHAL_5G480900 [Panicum hallii]|uniref:Uncharacterized protein n=2 Tax=Panicum hallii TaxID=206008 RepID=A0A2T8INT7_9POAL|nr:hypothetical protein PAHAL_5G480900 [Panicum hallii]
MTPNAASRAAAVSATSSPAFSIASPSSMAPLSCSEKQGLCSHGAVLSPPSPSPPPTPSRAARSAAARRWPRAPSSPSCTRVAIPAAFSSLSSAHHTAGSPARSSTESSGALGQGAPPRSARWRAAPTLARARPSSAEAPSSARCASSAQGRPSWRRQFRTSSSTTSIAPSSSPWTLSQCLDARTSRRWNRPFQVDSTSISISLSLSDLSARCLFFSRCSFRKAFGRGLNSRSPHRLTPAMASLAIITAAAPPPLSIPLVHRQCTQRRGQMETNRARNSMTMEERRLTDLARMVPATLLLVGTSEKVITSIKGARELLAGDKWGFDDSDDPASPPSNHARGGDRGASDPVETTGGGDHSVETTGGGDHSVGGVPLKPTCGSPANLRGGIPVNNGGGEGTIGIRDCTSPGFDKWADAADILATALAPEGHLPVAYREITRLVSLHAEAGHVFVVCAARLGLQHVDDDDDEDARTGVQTDHNAPWKRWMDLREAAVRHAHDALLRLSCAASAAAAAEDFLRWRSNESPRWEGWRSAARQLVQDARRSLGEAKDAVRLMRDAVLCEFFETWMILKRA